MGAALANSLWADVLGTKQADDKFRGADLYRNYSMDLLCPCFRMKVEILYTLRR